MIWSRLKSYKCPNPKCNHALKDIGRYYACTRTGCPFSINKEKFNEMLAEMYKPKSSGRIVDNQEALNNL